MFLVLDHNQNNPQFRAPIGNSPKVNFQSDDTCLDASLITVIVYP
jgi:hypothetical protein